MRRFEKYRRLLQFETLLLVVFLALNAFIFSLQSQAAIGSLSQPQTLLQTPPVPPPAAVGGEVQGKQIAAAYSFSMSAGCRGANDPYISFSWSPSASTAVAVAIGTNQSDITGSAEFSQTYNVGATGGVFEGARPGVTYYGTMYVFLSQVSNVHGLSTPSCESSPPPCSPTAPAAPTLYSPTNGASFSSSTSSVTLDWNDVTSWGNECSGTNDRVYAVYFGTSSSPPFLAYSSDSAETVSVGAGKTYWWRIRALNKARAVSGYSELRSFTVGAAVASPTPTPTPITITPATNLVAARSCSVPGPGNNVRVDYFWTRAYAAGRTIDAQWLDYSIYNNNFASGTYTGVDVGTTATTLSLGGFAQNLDYYWRVNTHFSGDPLTTWYPSVTKNFLTPGCGGVVASPTPTPVIQPTPTPVIQPSPTPTPVAVGAPTLIAPKGPGASTTPTFSWQDTAGFSFYYVYLRTGDSDFNSGDFWYTSVLRSNNCSGDDCSVGWSSAFARHGSYDYPGAVTPDSLTTDQTYAWMVWACSGSPTSGLNCPSSGLSQSASFTVGAVATPTPTPVAINGPWGLAAAAGCYLTAPYVNFAWTKGSGYSELWIDVTDRDDTGWTRYHNLKLPTDATSFSWTANVPLSDNYAPTAGASYRWRLFYDLSGVWVFPAAQTFNVPTCAVASPTPTPIIQPTPTPTPAPVGAPTLIAPQGPGAATNPTFSWQSGGGSDRYYLYVKKGDVDLSQGNFWYKAVLCAGSSCQVTWDQTFIPWGTYKNDPVPASLTAGQPYSWLVWACGFSFAEACPGSGLSQPFSFTVGAVATPTPTPVAINGPWGLAAAAGCYLTAPYVNFAWTKGSGYSELWIDVTDRDDTGWTRYHNLKLPTDATSFSWTANVPLSDNYAPTAGASYRWRLFYDLSGVWVFPAAQTFDVPTCAVASPTPTPAPTPTPPPAVGAPSLISPKGPGVTTNPTFSWQSGGGSDRYYLYVRNGDANFSSGDFWYQAVLCDTSSCAITWDQTFIPHGTYGSQQVPVSLTTGQSYSWMVWACGGSFSNCPNSGLSQPASFTVGGGVASPTPTPVAITGPWGLAAAAGCYLTAPYVNFSWTKGSGYSELWIDVTDRDDTGWTRYHNLKLPTDATSFSWTANVPLSDNYAPTAGASYRWRLFYGLSGIWVFPAAQTFDVPTCAVASPTPTPVIQPTPTPTPAPTKPGPFSLIAPPNGSTNVSQTPSFSWQNSQGADHYWIYVGKPGQQFSWYSLSFSQNAVWSANWQILPGAPAGTPNAPASLEAGQWQWTVAAENQGLVTWASQTFSFTVGAVATPTPTPVAINGPWGLAAAAGCYLTAPYVNFAWTKGSGYSELWIDVTDRDDTGWTRYHNLKLPTDATSFSWTANVPLSDNYAPTAGASYRWRLFYDLSGIWVFPAAQTFDVPTCAVASPTPTLVPPSNLSTEVGCNTGISPYIIFRWNQGANFTALRLDVTRADDTDWQFYRSKELPVTATSFTWSLDSLLSDYLAPAPNTTYRWRLWYGVENLFAGAADVTTLSCGAVTPTPTPAITAPTPVGAETGCYGAAPWVTFNWTKGSGYGELWIDITDTGDRDWTPGRYHNKQIPLTSGDPGTFSWSANNPLSDNYAPLPGSSYKWRLYWGVPYQWVYGPVSVTVPTCAVATPTPSPFCAPLNHPDVISPIGDINTAKPFFDWFKLAGSDYKYYVDLSEKPFDGNGDWWWYTGPYLNAGGTLWPDSWSTDLAGGRPAPNTGLEPGKYYYWRASVTNDCNQFEFSRTAAQFRYLAVSPTPIPTPVLPNFGIDIREDEVAVEPGGLAAYTIDVSYLNGWVDLLTLDPRQGLTLPGQSTIHVGYDNGGSSNIGPPQTVVGLGLQTEPTTPTGRYSVIIKVCQYPGVDPCRQATTTLTVKREPINLAVVDKPNCSDSPYTVTLKWENSAYGWWADLSTNSSFPAGGYSKKNVDNLTQTGAPAGFDPAITLDPDKTYYWRIWNGLDHFPGPPFVISKCKGPGGGKGGIFGPQVGTKDEIKNYIKSVVPDITFNIRNHGPDSIQKFLWGLAGCESTWDSGNVGSQEYPSGSGKYIYFYGLYQYLPNTWINSNKARLGPNSPRQNIYNGLIQVDHTNWRLTVEGASQTEWPACTDGNLSREWINFVSDWP